MAISRTERFRQAAWAYFAYGAIWWLGLVHLHSLGRAVQGGKGWLWAGAFVVVVFPWLIASGTQGPFYLWFSRLLTLVVLLGAAAVGQTVLDPKTETLPLPGRVEIPTRVGATIFLVIALFAAWKLARASWFPGRRSR